MDTQTKEIKRLREDMDELKSLVTNLIPYDEGDLKPSVRARLRKIADEKPVAQYQPGMLTGANNN